MATRTEYTVIGSFVLGAVALLVTALLVFGSGMLWQDRASFIIHFQSAMKGLNVGAVVRYRGVTIGQVRSVEVHVTPHNWRSYNSVIIEINARSLHLGETSASLEKTMPQLIADGLRAQTRLDSIITASSYIEIVIRADTPVNMLNDDDDQGLVEIPAIPSEIDRMDRALASIDYEAVVTKVMNVLDGMSATFGSNGLAQGVATLPRLLDDARGMLTGVTEQVCGAATALRSMAQAGTALAHTGMVTAARITPHAQIALAEMSMAAQQIAQAAGTIQQMLTDDSPQREQMNAAIRDLAGAARELRNLLDYLERHPEALLKGRTSHAE
jgi:paraquat-inducible protein B